MTDVLVQLRSRPGAGLLVAVPAALLLLLVLGLAAGSAGGHSNGKLGNASGAPGTVTAGGAACAAFAFFGKRRRDDEGPEDGLESASAGTASEAEAVLGLEAVDEALLPRWRRPSLQQVRRADPLRAGESAPSLSFESAGVKPLEDYERRVIGYRLVRLLDSPDELRSREIGVLDQGDEVQLLERRGAFWLVLCPDGRTGWLHRMTLADPRQAELMEDAAAPLEPDPMPEYVDEAEAFETVEDPEDSGDDGLLEAYMTARRDVLRTMASGEPGAAEASADAPAFCTFEAATFAALPGAQVEAAPQPVEASSQPVMEPASAETPAETLAAKPERAGAQYSARKTAGTRKAATASRPGTKSRRPSR
jgi:hypothetical protein